MVDYEKVMSGDKELWRSVTKEFIIYNQYMVKV